MIRFPLRRAAWCCAAAAFASTAASTATAATATATFTVSANIVASCTVAATNLSFGTYNPASGTALTGSSTISVYCTNSTPYTVFLNAGTGTGSTFTTRKLLNSTTSTTLGYNLYTSSQLTTVWGDTTASTGDITGTGAGTLTAVPATVYGSIPINQDMAPGTYSSTITVTVNY